MLLGIIWSASVMLAATSLGIMMLLIVRRMIIDLWERRRRARQDKVRALVFEYLEKPEGGRDLPARLTVDEKESLREIVEDLARVLRGPARDNLLDLVDGLGGLDFFREVLASGTGGRQANPGAVAVNWFLPPGWGSEDHRLRAIAALALFDDPRAVEALTAGLADRSSRVRLAAAQALVDIGAAISVRDLIGHLDIGREIRSRRLRELFRDLASRQPDEMTALLDADVSDTVKVLLLYGLAGTRDPSLIPAVAARFASPSIDVRAECLRTLAMIAHPDATPTILAGLGDESWVVRAQAAIAAGAVGVVEAFPLLSALLTDGEWWVRFRAAQALARIGEEGRAILMRVAEGSESTKDIASAVLAEVEAAT